ncbi:MAG: hypothetical protein JKY48_06680 [Flavobacteriales bacterium]|nr:hypothetical protein [Flavobacteriales bacterium]
MNWLSQGKYRVVLLGISLLAIPFFAFTQNQNIPLNQSFSFDSDRTIIQSDQIVHFSFKPLILRESATNDVVSSLIYKREDGKSWVAKKLFHEHFISLDTGIVQLTIDPVFNFEINEDREANTRGDVGLYKNTRGFNIKLLIGNKVAIESSFRENQAVLPYYLDQRTRSTGVAYGQGRTKTFKDDGFDFAMASSYVSYSPSDRINIQIGNGKHFVGNGHRSLLLSDVAFNYPFLKLNTNWFNNKLQYQNLYTLYQDLNRLVSVSSTEGLFERKQGATHYLEFSPNNKLSIGIFESTIFPSIDSTGNVGVGANYWAPIIFLNTAIEGDKDKGNNLIGVNFNYSLIKRVQIYGQYAILGKNERYQIGTKIFPHKNLLLQAEYNSLSDVRSNNLFYHYNESLTHPVGYKSSELIGILQYKNRRFLTRASFNMILSDNLDVAFTDFKQSYIVNPSFNFTLHAGVQIRSVEHEFELLPTTAGYSGGAFLNATIVYFGLSTNLQNLYFNY